MTYNAQDPDNQSVQRIRTVSRRMVIATNIVLALVALAVIYVWLDPSIMVDAASREALGHNQPVTVATETHFGLLLNALPVLGLYFAGLWYARSLFAGFAEEAIFTPEAGNRLVRFGTVVALLAPAQIIARAIGSVILTIHNPPGTRMLAISVEGMDAAMIVIGIAIIVLGWVMREAATIAAENREFV